MTPVRADALRGYAAVLVSSALYGTYGLWSRLMGATFPPFYQAWVRSLIIIIVMLPAAFERAGTDGRGRRLRRVERADWAPVGLFLFFCVFTQVPIYYAFNHAPVGMVQLIFYAVFIITAYTVARFYLAELITRVKLVAMVLTIAGMGLVFGAGLLSWSPLGLLLAGAGGVASGAEMSATKRISQKYPPAYLVLLGWVATLLTHLPASILVGERQQWPRADLAWLWLLLYALANAVAFWLSVEGFKRVDASIGSLIGVTEALFAVLVAAIALRQTPTWSTVAGGCAIIIAAMVPELWALGAPRFAVPVPPVGRPRPRPRAHPPKQVAAAGEAATVAVPHPPVDPESMA